MIPLFKSHYSLKGRSILDVNAIIELHQASDNKHLVLVEDSFASFRKFRQRCEKEKINFVFGIRLKTVQSKMDEKPSKLIFFAKNAEGINNLRRIYSKAFEAKNEAVKIDWVVENELQHNVKVAVPFYDSFIYNNLFYFGLSHLDLTKFDVEYFEEDNNHPHDHLISQRLRKFTDKNIQQVKSIYYENREDFKAFQAFKAICNRSGGGRPPVFDNPQIEGLCSNEFCWESYNERNKI